jgi:hypothetical protein
MQSKKKLFCSSEIYLSIDTKKLDYFYLSFYRDTHTNSDPLYKHKHKQINTNTDKNINPLYKHKRGTQNTNTNTNSDPVYKHKHTNTKHKQ